MRFTVLLTDRYDKGDMRLLLDAGFVYQSYVSCWDKVFIPDTPPVLEYVKLGRLFQRQAHVVLVVMIENYYSSSLSVAHYVQSGRDLRSWALTRPSADTLRIGNIIDQVVLKATPARRLHGPALATLRQDVVCCARVGVVLIERVRHCESAVQSKIRILATEIDKHIGSVRFGFDANGPTAQMHIGAAKFDVGARTPIVRVYIKNKRLQSIFDRVATLSGLFVSHLVPTGNAQAILSGDSFQCHPAHRLYVRSLVRKRKRVNDEDLALIFGPLNDNDTPRDSKRRRIHPQATLSATLRTHSLATVLGKRKYDEISGGRMA